MGGCRELRVDAHRGVAYDGFWWVFVEANDEEEAIIRQVHSLDEVRALMSELGCATVIFGHGSYEEMVAAGVAPEERPDWLHALANDG